MTTSTDDDVAKAIKKPSYKYCSSTPIPWWEGGVLLHIQKSLIAHIIMWAQFVDKPDFNKLEDDDFKVYI